MTKDELKELRDSFGEIMQNNPTLQLLNRQLGRLVAHLESEQEKRTETEGMARHHNAVLYGDPDIDRPGLIGKMNVMWRWHTKLIALAGAAVGTGLTLLFKHFLP